MNRLLAYGIVVVAAGTPWLEVLLVVPAAILAGLSPPLVVLVAAIGNIATLLPVVYAGDRLRERVRRRRRVVEATGTSAEMASDDPDTMTAEATGTSAEMASDDPDSTTAEATAAPRAGRGRRLFDRYGLPGLALLGPLVTGIHVAAGVAVAAGVPRRPTVLWLSSGVLLWSVIAAVVTVLGVDLFVDPEQLPDLFGGQAAS